MIIHRSFLFLSDVLFSFSDSDKLFIADATVDCVQKQSMKFKLTFYDTNVALFWSQFKVPSFSVSFDLKCKSIQDSPS